MQLSHKIALRWFLMSMLLWHGGAALAEGNPPTPSKPNQPDSVPPTISSLPTPQAPNPTAPSGMQDQEIIKKMFDKARFEYFAKREAT